MWCLRTPQLDLIMTIRGCSFAAAWDDGLSRPFYFCYHPTQRIIGHWHRLRTVWTALVTLWWPNVVIGSPPKLDLIMTHTRL